MCIIGVLLYRSLINDLEKETLKTPLVVNEDKYNVYEIDEISIKYPKQLKRIADSALSEYVLLISKVDKNPEYINGVYQVEKGQFVVYFGLSSSALENYSEGRQVVDGVVYWGRNFLSARRPAGRGV